MNLSILTGDCIQMLKTLPDQSVNCCVTSPPYYGLRDYGHDGQIGLEETPEAYTAKMVEAFREVRRVLKDDGTLWLNLGDSYASNTKGSGGGWAADPDNYAHKAQAYGNRKFNIGNSKPKDLMGIPWRVAFALQADGWCLRQDIIWHKPNPMPESVKDRCTKAHEYIFLLTKSARYWYDAEAISEVAMPHNGCVLDNRESGTGKARGLNGQSDRQGNFEPINGHRNRRSVWTVATQPYSGAHFATFPPALIEPCVLAGCPSGGTVLDPFGGSGTTAMVAEHLGRNSILIELNPEYVQIIKQRTAQQGMCL